MSEITCKEGLFLFTVSNDTVHHGGKKWQMK